jgi:long-chain acyl-CoA synthetase
MRKLVSEMIDEVNARVSTTESIKKFELLAHDFEIEKDEVTPTGKLKREVVSEHHRNLIESLYV